MFIIRNVFFVIFFLILFFIFPPICFAQIVINEFYAPTTSDWVELHNTSDNPIDVSGWILDDEDTSTNMLEIPQETTISAKSIVAFEVKNRLNKPGDTIYLFNSSNEKKDSRSYDQEVNNDVSFGRKPDGGSWHKLSPPTKGQSNNSSDIVDPVSSPSPSPSPNSQSSLSPTPSSSSDASTVTVFSPSPSLETVIKEGKEEKFEETDFTGEVFGVSENNEEDKAEEEEKKEEENGSSLSLIISLSGIFFLSIASFPFLKPKLLKLIKKIKKSPGS